LWGIAVYTIAPFVRTAKDVVDEVMRDRRRKDRPLPQNKQMRAELTRIIDDAEVNGKDLIFSWFSEEIKARSGNDDKSVVLCIMMNIWPMAIRLAVALSRALVVTWSRIVWN